MMSTDKSSRPEPVWNPTPLALTRRAAMLSAPLRSKVFERQSNEHYRACACSMQGFRQSMEDRHNIILSLSQHPDYAFFGIYDGHNGSEAAIHLATNLSERINNLQSIEDSNAIIDAVVEMDNEFINTPMGASGSTMVFALVQTTCLPSMPSSTSIDLPDRETSNTKNNKEVPRQLSDASNSSDRTVLVDDETTEPAVSYKIRVFWAGDSRALVGRFASFQSQSETDQKLSDSDFVQTLLDEAKENARVRGVPEPSDENPPNGTNRTFCPVGYVSDVPSQYHFTCATKDHSPNEESERARIVATGGKVSMGRVNGHLAVSRAFGDSNFKCEPSRSVIAACEVSEFTCEQGDFLFLFCDGLVEKFENDDLIQTLRNELRACERGMFHCGRKDSAYALANVFETALDSGSTDNMSAIFVQFTDGGGYAEECGLSTYLPGPMYMKRQETPWVRNYLAHAARYGHTDLYLLRKAAYKEDIRRLEAPCTCHELMEEMGDTSEEAVKARESKRSRNGKYMRHIEAELNLLREQKKQELAGVPKPIKRGSGSTELYSTDDLEPSETTPPLLMDDDDEDGDVAMQDARSSDLARRVTDLGEISLSRSDSMIISEDWGNDNARDSFHQTSSEILRALPLDSVACLSSPEADDIQVSLGQKRQRSNESVGSPVKSRSVSGESGPHSKKRRIEVSHSTWLKHKDSGSGSEVVV